MGEGIATEEALDVAWFAGAIKNLDKNWADRWTRLEEEVNKLKKEQSNEVKEIVKQQVHIGNQTRNRAQGHQGTIVGGSIQSGAKSSPCQPTAGKFGQRPE